MSKNAALQFEIKSPDLARLQRNLRSIRDRHALTELRKIQERIGDQIMVPVIRRAIPYGEGRGLHIKDTARVESRRTAEARLKAVVGGTRPLFYGWIIDVRWFHWREKVLTQARDRYAEEVNLYLRQRLFRRIGRGMRRG